MKRVISIILLLSVFMVGCDASTLPASIDPFGHIFRVEEILYSEDSDASLENTPIFQFDVFGGCHMSLDTNTYPFASVGKAQKQKLEKLDSRQALWLFSVENTSERYELNVEQDDSITICKTVDSKTLWKYKLDRVDTISANVSSAAVKSALELDWYYTDTFSGDLSQLSGATIYGTGKIGIYVDNQNLSEITVYEEYYVDGVLEPYSYVLNQDTGYGLSLSTRYTSGEQYAVYRIPYENGEYVFYLNFLAE